MTSYGVKFTLLNQLEARKTGVSETPPSSTPTGGWASKKQEVNTRHNYNVLYSPTAGRGHSLGMSMIEDMTSTVYTLTHSYRHT